MHDVPEFLVAGLDGATVDAIRASNAHDKQKLKFADYDGRIGRAWEWGTESSGWTIPALDTWEQPGYFIHVCKRLGHNSLGLDRPASHRLMRARVAGHSICPS